MLLQLDFHAISVYLLIQHSDIRTFFLSREIQINVLLLYCTVLYCTYETNQLVQISFLLRLLYTLILPQSWLLLLGSNMLNQI